MTLAALFFTPFLGAFLVWCAGRFKPRLARWVSLGVLCLCGALLARLWTFSGCAWACPAAGEGYFAVLLKPWIPSLGADFHLAMDGLSFLMVALTVFLGILSVLCSWKEIEKNVGFFHFNLLCVLGGVMGVFLAMDLLLFFILWEIMIVPMYLLINIWGHENRSRAAMKFFMFTQASGFVMLISIVGLYFAHGQLTGDYTFNYFSLLGTPLPLGLSLFLMLGFFAAFAVKLPMVPFHTWLPDAHTSAPTAGSVDLAGLLLKTGAYGLMRFAVPLFPEAAKSFAPIAMAFAVAGILYGAVAAMGQKDLKRLIAYTSVSHMGFVLLAIFAWNSLALQGAVMLMICHGLSSGALFILVGIIYERLKTRDLDRLGGLWATAPRMGALTIVFCMASMGLPGLGNFVAEFLVLMGSFSVSPRFTAAAALGLVAGTIYSLWILQKAFQGPSKENVKDLSWRESFMLGSLALGLVVLGFFPRPVLNAAKPAIDLLQQTAQIKPVGEKP